MDITKKTKRPNKNTVTVASETPAPKKQGFTQKVANFFSTAFGYGYAGLKIVDVVARAVTAAAVWVKWDIVALKWGAAFLGATVLCEIGAALFKAYGPNRK